MNKVDKIIKAYLKKEAPFKSPQQEAWMWTHIPEIARKWYKEHGNAKGYSEYLKKRKKRK